MAFQISGIIQQIGNTESIPYQDKVFKKRELVLDCSYRNQFTGQIERANYPKFEFAGNHVDDLNGFNMGDIVTVSSAQQAAMESARNAASASNFPPAVDANGSPIQGNNDDLPF